VLEKTLCTARCKLFLIDGFSKLSVNEFVGNGLLLLVLQDTVVPLRMNARDRV